VVPDIICCYRGRFVAFEVKTATGKPTKLQEHTIAKIKAAKGEAFIVRSVQEVQQILDALEAKHDQKGIIPAILAQPRD
jgi:Holliday junction resolvase